MIKCRTIAISNAKGGVGKTTTALNLGAALAERGKRVLLVELDQQGSLTTSAGIDPEELEETIYNVLSSHADTKEKHPAPLKPLIKNISNNLDLVPANVELSAIEMELFSAYSREYTLDRVLKPVKLLYDYILLDCPPSLSLLVVNALTTADEVLIPLQVDYLATKGVNVMISSIEAVQSKLNPGLKIAGIVLTMADTRTGHARQVIDTTRANLAGVINVFNTVIKLNVRLKEAPISGKSILSYDSGSDAAASYRQLAEELDNA